MKSLAYQFKNSVVGDFVPVYTLLVQLSAEEIMDIPYLKWVTRVFWMQGQKTEDPSSIYELRRGKQRAEIEVKKLSRREGR